MRPDVLLTQLAPGVTVTPMPGLTLKRLEHTGFVVARVHYTVMKNRRNPAWAKATAAKYGRKGTASWKWRREMEIDFKAAGGDMVFANWADMVHLVDPFEIPPNWPRWLLYDIGGVNPHSLDWWAMDPTPPDYPLYQYRQWYRGQDMPDGSPGGYFLVKDVVQIAHALSVNPDGTPEKLRDFILDPQVRQTKAAAGAKPTERAATLYEEIVERVTKLGWPIDVLTGNNLKDQAIEDVIDRLGNYPIYKTLANGELELGPQGEPLAEQEEDGTPKIAKPRLFVFKTCNWTAWEMALYRWKEWSSDMVAEHENRPESPVDKNDHAITNLIRLMNWIRRDPIFDRREPVEESGDLGTQLAHKWRRDRGRRTA